MLIPESTLPLSSGTDNSENVVLLDKGNLTPGMRLEQTSLQTGKSHSEREGEGFVMQLFFCEDLPDI